MSIDYDHIIKIIVVGDTAVGKTSILTRYADDKFNPDHKTTLGVDFKIRTLTIRSKTIKLQMWDTAGQERWSGITKAYYRGAQGAIYTFSLTNRKTFEHIGDWIESVTANCSPCSILVGNKCDLKDQIVVSNTSIVEFCKKNDDMPYIETSAKNNTNVHEAFDRLATDILNILEEAKLTKIPMEYKPQIEKGVDLLEMDENKEKKCAC